MGKWPQENARQPVSRVLSARLTGRDDHSSGTHLTMRLTRPTRAAGRERPCSYHGVCNRNITAAPIRSCSRWGLPCRPCCQGRGALLPHRFALARGVRPACAGRPCTGGLFSVALSLGSPPPAVSRHRVPVEPGLSSTHGIAPPAAAVQLSGGVGFAPARSGGQAVRRPGRGSHFAGGGLRPLSYQRPSVFGAPPPTNPARNTSGPGRQKSRHPGPLVSLRGARATRQSDPSRWLSRIAASQALLAMTNEGRIALLCS
jgi:hypothetical protein